MLVDISSANRNQIHPEMLCAKDIKKEISETNKSPLEHMGQKWP
jgi:hypothetical protein